MQVSRPVIPILLASLTLSTKIFGSWKVILEDQGMFPGKTSGHSRAPASLSLLGLDEQMG